MDHHRFDPLSFALGVLTIGVAIAVIAGHVLDTDRSATGGWLALGALVLGLGLIPWPRSRTTATADGPAPEDEDALDQLDVNDEPTSGSA